MMATASPPSHNSGPRSSNLDVDWLLHGKTDFTPCQPKDKIVTNGQDTNSKAPPQKPSNPVSEPAAPPQPAPEAPSTRIEPEPVSEAVPTTVEPQKPQPVHAHHHHHHQAPASPLTTTPTAQPSSTQAQVQSQHAGRRPSGVRGVSEDNSKGAKSHFGGLKKEGRRSSWLSSLGHKIAGGSSRSSNASEPSQTRSPLSSPKVEFGNPFDKKMAKEQSKQVQTQQQPEVLTHHVPQGPRRPSVLVAAGSETKLDNPGFLTNALRRLSSNTGASLGKGAGQGAICPRKVMNIDENRQRSKIQAFEQNKLRRVAFCVDVEIAGIAAQADEEPPLSGLSGLQPIGHPATSHQSANHKDSKDAKYKEKGEGAALKHPETAKEEKDTLGQTQVDTVSENKQERKESLEASPNSPTEDNDVSPERPEGENGEKRTTRKKEKKKRSEAERKERRARKRRHAVNNGLVPLELIRTDSDSDSTTSSTPTGYGTPKNGENPTTDPLRIYKRCCALRETTPLKLVKEQIHKPAATLSEAPGTVAVVDLSGSQMSLQDIVTLSDWLAVVPVRKLILDDCGLGDEAVRVILCALLSCKTAEQARANRKLPGRGSGRPGLEQMGVIEKLSLKNNSAVTKLGWKHIALFIHLSQSLRAIDLSGIPYPKSNGDVSQSNLTVSTSTTPAKSTTETGTLVARAIRERFGEKLEELILSGCALSPSNLSEIVDAVVQCRTRRLGVAGNFLNSEGLGHIVRYLESGICEGLDLGSNDLRNIGHILSEAIKEDNPLLALSLASCNLTAEDLTNLIPKMAALKSFKFVDLSHNHELFRGDKNAVHILRRYLPKMKSLKRMHLVDVDMMPEHIMALADIFPDCPALAHINVLENKPLVETMNSSKIDSQEEAAAFLASLMTATRVSSTMIAVELEMPSAESSEVVRALSSQVVAYSLRNMERSALNEVGEDLKAMPENNAPEVLLHLVGHMDGYKENHDYDDPAPDEDYLIASTGVVRALSVCLDKNLSRSISRQITPTASGTATPRGDFPRQAKKPKDVSFELCESARKIRMRLRPALVKEDQAGNRDNYMRLYHLDQTLERIIQRFEDEYPDVRNNKSSLSKTPPSADINSPPESPNVSRVSSMQDGTTRSNGIHHTSSSTSLASRALMHEEGRMHRFGQVMRRELLKPVGTDDYVHGTSINDAPEPAHLEALRGKLAGLSGEEIRDRVESEGADNVVKDLSITAEELKMMAQDNPVGFEALRNCALMNEVRRMSVSSQGTLEGDEHRKASAMPGSFNTQVTT